MVDNLNRATTIGGVSRTYDILGNTLTKGSISMTWDVLNRMTGLGSQSYSYRADGMRTKKAVGQTWTSYRYDGQMPIEEYNDGPGQPRSFLQTIRYGLGARGIDYIERITNASVVTKGYPVYDAHGNNVATLQKSGTSYSLSDQRSYDAWGGVRTGSTTGEPNARYCASLGHLADDESGFIYMRARYYEPAIGRFVSEDQAKHGWNWITYANNSPLSYFDKDGHFALPDTAEGWMERFKQLYGDWQEIQASPTIDILKKGAAACSALILWASRMDGVSVGLTGAAIGSTSVVGIMPWLPGLLSSLASVARLSAGGLKFAASLIAYTTIILALTVTEAY